MIRKLAIALTIVSAGYAGVVQALGLGEATVTSSLNQPLVAEIELENTGGLTIAEILPGLATREEFLRAGIDRVYFLSDIRFDVQQGADGEPKVVLTSKKPVREPFLNFLVEVIWPSGRLLREYALLIDPPVFAEDKPIAATPTSTSAPASSAVVKPVATPVQKPASGDHVAVRSVKPQSGALAGSGSYGPTKSSDTLWDIASKVRPDSGISPQQVMLAIQDLNPEAFIDGNINKLKTGQILRLPSRDQMASRSAYAAIDAVIEQNAAMRKPKTKTPASSSSTSTASTPKTGSDSGDRLKLVAPDKDAKAAESASSDAEGTSASGSASSEELSLTLEQLDKAKLENKELTGKVDDLEEQLETLQRLLTLKNDQLAALQVQMRANEQAQDQAEAELAEADGMADEAASETVAGALEQGAEPLESEVVTQETDSPDQLTVGEGQADAAVEEAAVPEVATAKVEEKQPVATQIQPVEKPKSIQDKILDMVMSNPLYQLGLVVTLIVLLGILRLISNARAKQEAIGYDVDDEFESGDGFEDSEDDQDLYGAEEASSDDEFEAEQSDEAASDAQEEKEDVIEEASAYIAYGRLDQAAEVLEQGINDDPLRADYRLKLLEVYRDAMRADAFARQYSELEAIQDADALARAQVIKSELDARLADPDLVAGAQSFETPESSVDSSDLTSLDEEDFDFEAVDESPEQGASEVEDIEAYAEEGADEVGDEIDFSSEDLDVDLDIDLGMEQPETPEVEDSLAEESLDLEFEAPSLEEEPELESLDLELDEGVTQEELEHEAEIPLELADELEVDEVALDEESSLLDSDELDDLSMDLDDELSLEGVDETVDDLDELALDLDEEPALEEVVESTDDAADDLLLDLDDDISLEAEPMEAAELSGSDLELDDDLSVDGLDIESDASDLDITDETLDEAAKALGDADDFEPELSEDEDFDFLEGTDEVSTKLDLARAYIDMGDPEGAKEILLEVEKEGSADQKQQATDLIASLGS